VKCFSHICTDNKNNTDNKNTFYIFFLENRAVREIMWKNIIDRVRSQMTIWLMRLACWITKAANTHSEYIIPIAFPVQQWLHESASV
jgi:hypothetical protein